MFDSEIPRTKDADPQPARPTHHARPAPLPGDGPDTRLPHVVVFGGQDTPAVERLLGCWKARCSALLPAHHLTVTAWPRTESDAREQLAHAHVRGPEGSRPPRTRRRLLPQRLERVLCALLTAFVAWLDVHMHVSSRGEPVGLRSRFTRHFIRYTVAVLYGDGALGRVVLELAVRALSARPVDLVIGHSLGGTLALLAGWELVRRGEAMQPFALITLGTSSGHAITRSPLLAALPRTRDGEIALPPTIRSWEHFWSRTDALVAASSLPTAFANVELIEVDTGPFSPRNQAHALGAYLATPEVAGSIRLQLLRDGAEDERSEAC